MLAATVANEGEAVVGVAAGFGPGGVVEGREGDVAGGGLVDLGEFQAVGVRRGLAVDLAAAGYVEVTVVLEGLFEGVDDVDAVGGPGGLAGDDDGTAAGQRPATRDRPEIVSCGRSPSPWGCRTPKSTTH